MGSFSCPSKYLFWYLSNRLW